MDSSCGWKTVWIPISWLHQNLHRFLSEVSNFETNYTHCALFRFNTVCPLTRSPEVPYILQDFCFINEELNRQVRPYTQCCRKFRRVHWGFARFAEVEIDKLYNVGLKSDNFSHIDWNCSYLYWKTNISYIVCVSCLLFAAGVHHQRQKLNKIILMLQTKKNCCYSSFWNTNCCPVTPKNKSLYKGG